MLITVVYSLDTTVFKLRIQYKRADDHLPWHKSMRKLNEDRWISDKFNPLSRNTLHFCTNPHDRISQVTGFPSAWKVSLRHRIEWGTSPDVMINLAVMIDWMEGKLLGDSLNDVFADADKWLKRAARESSPSPTPTKAGYWAPRETEVAFDREGKRPSQPALSIASHAIDNAATTNCAWSVLLLLAASPC